MDCSLLAHVWYKILPPNSWGAQKMYLTFGPLNHRKPLTALNRRKVWKFHNQQSLYSIIPAHFYTQCFISPTLILELHADHVVTSNWWPQCSKLMVITLIFLWIKNSQHPTAYKAWMNELCELHINISFHFKIQITSRQCVIENLYCGIESVFIH